MVLLDAVLVIWVAAWIWLGLAIGGQVSGLRHTSATVARVGSAVQQSGKLLSTFERLPFVGDQVGKTADEIEQAGRSVVASARATRNGVAHLSWMLALAIALIPSTPVLGLYLPIRVIGIRERRTLAALWGDHAEDPAFRRFLAQRALSSLPYSRLAREGGPDPWSAFAAGRHDALARAELERWGMKPTVTATPLQRQDLAHQRPG